jgi:hypothetical protein
MLDFEHSTGQGNRVENGNGNRFSSRASLVSYGNCRHGGPQSQNCPTKIVLKARTSLNQVVAKPMRAVQLWTVRTVMLVRMVWSPCWNQRLLPALLFLRPSYLLSLPQDEPSFLYAWQLNNFFTTQYYYIYEANALTIHTIPGVRQATRHTMSAYCSQGAFSLHALSEGPLVGRVFQISCIIRRKGHIDITVESRNGFCGRQKLLGILQPESWS